jgi:hypothetical protein
VERKVSEIKKLLKGEKNAFCQTTSVREVYLVVVGGGWQRVGVLTDCRRNESDTVLQGLSGAWSLESDSNEWRSCWFLLWAILFKKIPVKYLLMVPVVQFRDDLLALLNLSRA